VLIGGADDTERAGTEAAAKALILAFLEKLEDKIYIYYKLYQIYHPFLKNLSKDVKLLSLLKQTSFSFIENVSR